MTTPPLDADGASPGRSIERVDALEISEHTFDPPGIARTRPLKREDERAIGTIGVDDRPALAPDPHAIADPRREWRDG